MTRKEILDEWSERKRTNTRIKLSKMIVQHWLRLTALSTAGVFGIVILVGFQLYGFYLDSSYVLYLVGMTTLNGVLPHVIKLLEK